MEVLGDGVRGKTRWETDKLVQVLGDGVCGKTRWETDKLAQVLGGGLCGPLYNKGKATTVVAVSAILSGRRGVCGDCMT